MGVVEEDVLRVEEAKVLDETLVDDDGVSVIVGVKVMTSVVGETLLLQVGETPVAQAP